MKKILFVLFLLVGLNCAAQDEVVFHNGNIAKGKVSEVTEISIKFCYEGEDAMNIIGRAAIAEIRFASGRVQQMSQKITIGILKLCTATLMLTRAFRTFILNWQKSMEKME